MCIFCNIINNEIPAYKIYETNSILAFLDISAVTKGHCLVVPKKHVENIFDLPRDIAKEIMEATAIIANLLKTKLNIFNINLLNNSGTLAGQTVMHFHLHIIPRYENDGITFIPQENEPDFQSLAKIHQTIIN